MDIPGAFAKMSLRSIYQFNAKSEATAVKRWLLFSGGYN
jgi:hypothetical protein